MSSKVEFDMDSIAEFCKRRRISELAIFGSVLRDDFGPQSDVDILVKFAPEARVSLLDLVDMEDELAAIIGRKVDVVCREGIERSHNPIRKKAILSTAEVLYAA